MSQNPYESPITPPSPRSKARRAIAMTLLAFLAVPAGSIAGAITCAAVGNSLYAANHQRLDLFVFYMLISVVPATLIAMVGFWLISCSTSRMHQPRDYGIAFLASLAALPAGCFLGAVAFFGHISESVNREEGWNVFASGIVGGTILTIPSLIMAQIVLAVRARRQNRH